MTAMMSPSLTWSFGATRTSVMVPATGASTGISIFIDSRIAIVSPTATVWPTVAGTCQTLAAISAGTSVTPLPFFDEMGWWRGHTTCVGFIIGLAISGLIIGALGRLAIPGRQPMGCIG